MSKDKKKIKIVCSNCGTNWEGLHACGNPRPKLEPEKECRCDCHKLPDKLKPPCMCWKNCQSEKYPKKISDDLVIDCLEEPKDKPCSCHCHLGGAFKECCPDCTESSSDWGEELSILLLDIVLKSKTTIKGYPLGQLEVKLTYFISDLILKEREKVIEEIKQGILEIGDNTCHKRQRYVNLPKIATLLAKLKTGGSDVSR